MEGKGGAPTAAGGGGRDVVYQRDNLTSFMMHRMLTAIGAEMVAEKAMSNRGRGRGGRPRPSPQRRLGWPVQGFCGGWKVDR